MTDITKLLGKKTRERGIMSRFMKLIKGKSKEEVRDIELALLKPAPLPKYGGKKSSAQSKWLAESITFSFPNKDIVERLGKFIKINTYIENNSYDIALFIEVLKLLENGTLQWKNETLYLKRPGKLRRKLG